MRTPEKPQSTAAVCWRLRAPVVWELQAVYMSTALLIFQEWPHPGYRQSTACQVAEPWFWVDRYCSWQMPRVISAASSVAMVALLYWLAFPVARKRFRA